MRFINAILNCIGTEFIGLPGCGTDQPDSALYLQDIPGIGQVLAAKVVSADDKTAAALFTKVYREGIIKVSRDFFSIAARKNWQLRTELDAEVVGKVDNRLTSPFTVTPPGAVGILLERCDSLHSAMIIEYVRVWATVGASVTITITDGTEVTPYTVTLEEGANIIRVDYMAKTDVVRISSDFVDATIRDTWNCSCNLRNCSCSACSMVSTNCHFSVKGQENLDGLAWVDSTTLNGFQVSVTCVADVSYVICRYKYDLAEAFRHAMAIQFFHELLQSRRGNPYASQESKDLAREQLVILNGGRDDDGGFIKGEYHKALNDAVTTVEPQLKTFGIFENTRHRVVTSLP